MTRALKSERQVFGARLRAARESQGLSLQDMARRTGRSPSFLSLVERGKRACPPYLATAYLSELGPAGSEPERSPVSPSSRSAETYVEEVFLTVVLLADGGCDYYDEHWTFQARRDGVHQLNIMEERAEEVRLWSFDVLAGGELVFEKRGKDGLAVYLRFPPLKAGQRHEISLREYPPSDLDTLTFFTTPDHEFRRLRFTVVIPDDTRRDYSLLRIDRLEPDLDSIPVDICSPVATTSVKTEVLFEALEAGVSYGIHWDW